VRAGMNNTFIYPFLFKKQAAMVNSKMDVKAFSGNDKMGSTSSTVISLQYAHAPKFLTKT